MAATYKTEGVILRRWNHREQDRGVRLFTRDAGKWTTRAIAARKLESKLAGHLEPFIVADFFIVKSRTMDILAGSVEQEVNKNIRADITRATFASYFCEAVDRLTQEHQRDVTLYEHIRRFLAWVNAFPPHLGVLQVGIARLLALLGYSLQLEYCLRCRRALQDEDVFFSFALSGCFCQSCGRNEDGVRVSMTKTTLTAAQILLYTSFDAEVLPQFSSEQLHKVQTFLGAVIAYHLHAPLRSELSLSAVVVA